MSKKTSITDDLVRENDLSLNLLKCIILEYKYNNPTFILQTKLQLWQNDCKVIHGSCFLCYIKKWVCV